MINDTLVIGVITAVVASVCTALPLLMGQLLRHREAMRKMDLAEKARVEAREDLIRRLNTVSAKVEVVAKNTNGITTQLVQAAEERGEARGVEKERLRSGFGPFLTQPIDVSAR